MDERQRPAKVHAVEPTRDHDADLRLARACAAGDAAALAMFDRTYAGYVAKIIASIDASPAFADEAKGVIHEKLFVAHGEEPPKIAEYGGRAALKSWLRVVVKRTTLNLARGLRRQGAPRAQEDDQLVATGASPELAYMKALYREQFEEAARSALAALSPRARIILRLHLSEGMTLAQLGAVYDVSHATAARWLAAAREALVDSVRASLTERLAMSPSDYDSMAALVRSQLDVSVVELLR